MALTPPLQPKLPPPLPPLGAPKPPAVMSPSKSPSMTLPKPSMGPIGSAINSFAKDPAGALKTVVNPLGAMGLTGAAPKPGAPAAAPGSSILNPGYDDLAKSTQSTPPLQFLTPKLPDALQGPANSILGFAQKGLQKIGPAGFAGLAGALAPGLVQPLLSTPFGIPALAGLNGLLSGGESFAAANTFFKPLLGKLDLA